MLLTSNTEKSVDNVNKCMPSTVREKFFTGCFAVVGLMFAIGGMEATAPITAVVALVAVIVVGVLLNFVYEKKLGGFKIENIGFLIAVIEGIVALATLVI
jgi:hypothetical protein